jgi:hypothetical protein
MNAKFMCLFVPKIASNIIEQDDKFQNGFKIYINDGWKIVCLNLKS